MSASSHFYPRSLSEFLNELEWQTGVLIRRLTILLIMALYKKKKGNLSDFSQQNKK